MANQFYYYFILCIILVTVPQSLHFAIQQEIIESTPFNNITDDVNLEDPCSFFYYLVSNSPCMFNISSVNNTLTIPINFEIIQNDDYDAINQVTNYGDLNKNLTQLTVSKNEIFHLIKIGGNLPFDIFGLDIYMIPYNVENGKIIGIDEKSFNKIILETYEQEGEIYFKIPNIFTRDSLWKIVVEYEINDEVEGFYFTPNFVIN